MADTVDPKDKTLDLKEEIRLSLQDEAARVSAKVDPDVKDLKYEDAITAFDVTLEEMKEAIRQEVQHDPAGLEYNGKTPLEIAALLNTSQGRGYVGLTLAEVKLKIANAEPITEAPEMFAEVPRVSVIFCKIPFAPNIVDESLITEALA